MQYDRVRRRAFVVLLCASAAWPLKAHAQRAGKVYRLAVLSGGTASSRVDLIAAFTREMRNLGYVDGQNLVVESRFADNRFETLPAFARDLLAWNPDAIFVSTTPAALAAKAATSTVPIVMVSVADPLGSGLISSLSRPGGNVTSITNIGSELAGKRIEILKEVLPAANRFAVLINPDDPNATMQMENARLAAAKLGVELEPVLTVRKEADLKVAFDAATKAGADAALRMLDPTATTLRGQTIAPAGEYRLPVIYAFRDIVSPRAFAVLRLITNSNLVGWATGRSTGFAPVKILCTKPAACPLRESFRSGHQSAGRRFGSPCRATDRGRAIWQESCLIDRSAARRPARCAASRG